MVVGSSETLATGFADGLYQGKRRLSHGPGSHPGRSEVACPVEPGDELDATEQFSLTGEGFVDRPGFNDLPKMALNPGYSGFEALLGQGRLPAEHQDQETLKEERSNDSGV